MLNIQFAPRDRYTNRVTSLELMFDLATVVAVAAAAHGLTHALESGDVAQGTIRFLCSFFMIWLAWLNYSWFASAYDNNSAEFRALSMMIMIGSLILAAGIRGAFNDQPIWLALLGFIVMRLGMIVLWLGAAKGDPARRSTALRYAGGTGLMQVYWITIIGLVRPSESLYLPLFVLGASGELLVPSIAESKKITLWHREHIIERYSLFNIIVLGECFAAIASIISEPALPEARHLWLAALCIAISFSMWDLYFTKAEHLTRAQLGAVLVWAYGHFVLFAAGAATAAGFAALLAAASNQVEISERTASLAIGIPVCSYLCALWVVRDRICIEGVGRWLLLIVAMSILAVSVIAYRVPEVISALLITTAVVRRRL